MLTSTETECANVFDDTTAPNIRRVAFEDDNRIDYEFFLESTEGDKYARMLIAKFRGRYRNGSAGAPDACFIQGITHTAIQMWSATGVILDLSGLEYNWGDEMDLLLDVGTTFRIPSATVVGPGCNHAIATLIWGINTARRATELENIFDNVDDAREFIRTAMCS